MPHMDQYHYYRDHRVIAGMTDKPTVSECRRFVLLEIEDEEGELIEHRVPCSWAVCPTCGGVGWHSSPSIDAGGLTQSDLADWTQEELDHYFAGGYDERCYECGGSRVVPVPDFTANEELARLFARKQRDDADYAQLCAMERALGA